MPILTPLDLHARVVWLGLVRDRAASLVSEAVETMTLDWGGPLGEARAGPTRPSCSRVARQYPRGTEIRNARQLSLVSAEELAEVAAALGLEALPPAWLGANVMVEGAPDLSGLPPSTRLIFDSGAALVVDMENAPCRLAAEVIEARRPGRGLGFPAAARGRRGVVAWVERPGRVALGDRARLHVPPRRTWRGLEPRLARAM
jgi:hypothetical protein